MVWPCLIRRRPPNAYDPAAQSPRPIPTNIFAPPAGNDFGYIQFYDLTAWNSGFGAHPKGTRGLDLFIGEPGMIERGHGSASIRALADERLAHGAPCMVTDLDPASHHAVRAYERAGFEKVRMIDTLDRPALLMVLNA